MTDEPRTLDADDAHETEPALETLLLCSCGMTEPSMDHYVDHVSDDHDVYDAAVNALLCNDADVDGERCACGWVASSMAHYIDHVAQDHDVFTIATNALLEGEVTVEVAVDG